MPPTETIDTLSKIHVSNGRLHLSAGQKRRVALAGLLAMEPEILLLDEPATFLDPPSRNHLIETLRELDQAQILVTHDLELARSLAGRAVFFEQGRVAGEGTVDEVAERFAWGSAPQGGAISSGASDGGV